MAGSTPGMDYAPARKAALAQAVEDVATLVESVPVGVLPITAVQWQRSLRDADLDTSLAAYRDARTLVASLDACQGRAIGRALRSAALDFVSCAIDLADRLEVLAALDPGTVEAPARAAEWRRGVIDNAGAVLVAVTEGADAPALVWSGKLPDVPARERDVLLDAFGVQAAELVDDTGSFSDARLIAAYRLRLDELQSACDRVVGLIAECPSSVFSAASGARDLVTSASPWTTLSVAREIRSRILRAFESDPKRTASVLADAVMELDKEQVSFARLEDRVRRAADASIQRERSIALLEAYKHMAEGHTRRWVRTLLRLAGMEDPPSTVGAIGSPAAAQLGGVGERVARALVPAVRNAEAHEDFTFDDASGVLVVGDTELTEQELIDSLTELDTLQRAWILGRLAAFTDCSELGTEVAGRASGPSSAASITFAKGRFAHAGQSIRSFVRDRDRVDIVIDGLQAEACNPCFLALTQAAAVLRDVTQFTVCLRGRPDPVIDLPATVLHSNLPVLHLACAHFPDGLPQSTFLPCLTWCRLACEPVEEAARVAAWLTLNDIQHAIDDAGLAPAREVPRLRARLEVVAVAARAASNLLPNGPHLEPLAGAARTAETTSKAVAHPDQGIVGSVLLDRVLRLRDRLGPPPAIMPTLDAAPLPEVSYPHPVS